MKSLNRKSGFTLIELIVVLIIVGILAAIALPNLFGNIQRQRAEEALATISSFRPTLEGCIMKDAGVAESTDCGPTGSLAGSMKASPNFTYTFTGPASATDTGYTITASGTGALDAASRIIVNRIASAWVTPPTFPAVTCTSAGQVAGAC